MSSKHLVVVVLLLISTVINTTSILEVGADAVKEINITDYLRLVNKDHPLPKDYVPIGLVDYHGRQLDPTALASYKAMLTAMEAELGAAAVQGLSLYSAYRSYEYQRNLFGNKTSKFMTRGYTKAAAELLAAQVVQPPGSSEHQLGLSVDVSTTGSLTEGFGDTVVGQWLAAYSHRYGFIIRYPQAKTDVTGIVYEPWHLRYVGNPHATIITHTGLALEEYLADVMACYGYVLWAVPGEDGHYYIVSYTTDTAEAVATATNIVSVNVMGDGYIVVERKAVPRQ